eukprot:505262_1
MDDIGSILYEGLKYYKWSDKEIMQFVVWCDDEEIEDLISLQMHLNGKHINDSYIYKHYFKPERINNCKCIQLKAVVNAMLDSNQSKKYKIFFPQQPDESDIMFVDVCKSNNNTEINKTNNNGIINKLKYFANPIKLLYNK